MSDHCRYSGCAHPDRLIGERQARVYAIRGYEQARSQGGQNHVLRKERLDGWVWHADCWEALMRQRDGRGEQLRLEAP